MELKQTYARHPLSECFGDMDDEEFQHFKDDIETHGQHEPVLLYDGMILDGWHRYLAVTQLGLDLQKFTFTGTFEEAQERVVSSNDKRKHRTVAQRAQAIVAVTACRPVGRPAKGNSAPGAELKKTPAPTAKKLADAHGIGARSVERARVVQAAGLGPLVVDGALSGKEAEAIATGKPAKAKPAAKPKRELAPPPPADDDSMAEAKHTITELAEENEQLRDKLAVESLMDSEAAKTQTTETIRELRALVKTLQAENAALKVSRDTYMRESAEAKKSALYWRKQAEKAAKDAA